MSLIFSNGDEIICKDLLENAKKYFTKEAFNVNVGNIVGASDHLSFINKSICAIGFMQEGMSDIIHTLNEDIGDVDFNYLEKLSNSIVGFIIENHDKTFIYEDAVPEESPEEKLMRETLNSLRFNEYKYIKIGNDVKVIDKYYTTIDDITEFNKTYPGKTLPEYIGNFHFSYVTIVDKSDTYVKNPQIEKISAKKTLFNNITQLSLTYNNTNNKSSQKLLRIDFFVFDKNNKNDMKLNSQFIGDQFEGFINGNIAKNYIDIAGVKYYPTLNGSDKAVNGLYRVVEDKNKFHHIIINSYDYADSEWPYKTPESNINPIKEMDLNKSLKNILNWFR